MSAVLLPPTPLPLSAPASWTQSNKVPRIASYVVENHVWLGRIFYVIHLARSVWHWQRQANEVYHYFQNPRLAIADLAINELVKNSPLFQTATLVAEVISSGFQTEEARQRMVKTWKKLHFQIKNPRTVYLIPSRDDSGVSFYYIFPKLKEIFQLLGQLFIHIYICSMHMMDVSDLISDPKTRKRAHRRLATNTHTIYQHSRPKLEELALALKYQPMPFFKYLGIDESYVTRMIPVSLKLADLGSTLRNST